MFKAKNYNYYYIKAADFSADKLLQGITAFRTTVKMDSFLPTEQFGRDQFLEMIEYGHIFMTRLKDEKLVRITLDKGASGEQFAVHGKPWLKIETLNKDSIV